MKYDDPKAITKTFELAEKFQYYLLQASCKLAQETEPAPFFNETKYSEGWLPIDDLPEENKRQTQMNWEQLRKDIRQYGLKNCVVSAIPPTASSSSVSNSTPGVEPPKKPITRMSSKQGVFPQLVKDWNKLKSFYTFQDEVKNEHYFKLIAQFQMFIDQSISTNEYFMWSNNDNPVKIGDIIKDIYQAHSLGLKTLYYMRTPSASAESTDAMSEHGVQDEGCSSGACAI
jgi:ribonucleoside-diphosphate reductase alpha chain